MTIVQALLATTSLILVMTGEPANAQAQPSPAPAAAPAQSQQLLSAAELDQLFAPIALYPDTLLAADSDGLDLSARGGAGRPLGHCEQEPQGRRTEERRDSSAGTTA